MTARLALALALAACAVSFGLGVRWQRGADAIEQAATVARVAEARRKDDERSATISADLESKLAESRAAQRITSRSVAHETQKPDYRCVLPARGVQLRSDAIRAARQPARSVR